MNRLFCIMLLALNVHSATLYLIDGEVLTGKVVVSKKLKDKTTHQINFMQDQKNSNSKPLTISKLQLDSVVVNGSTLHYKKGALIEHISDTSSCIFDIGKEKWKKGIYCNYAELYYNCPSIVTDWTVKSPRLKLMADNSKRVTAHNAYVFYDAQTQKEEKLKTSCYGYCDGENIYIINGSYLSKVLIGDQFLYTVVLDKISMDASDSTSIFMEKFNPVSSSAFTLSNGQGFLMALGLFAGGGVSIGGSNLSFSVRFGVVPSGRRVRRWCFVPAIIDNTTGIISDLFSFNPDKFEELIADQTHLLAEYKRIEPKIFDANPLLKTEFYFRYLDLINHPWFSWYDTMYQTHINDLKQYEKK